MVGTLTEDRAYALELTHTYGVAQYQAGQHRSLVNFGVVVADPAAVAAAAGALGYFTAPLPPVAGVEKGWQDASLESTMLVIGPDDYYYTLMTPVGAGTEPTLLPHFHHIALRVSSLHHSLQFYTKLLGMVQLSDEASQSARSVGVATASLLEGRPEGYADGVMSTAVGYESTEALQFALVLIDDGTPAERTGWSGRSAIAIPDAAVRRIHDDLLALEAAAARRGGGGGGSGSSSGRIIHPLQVLEEKLGMLLVLIVADPDGNELCLVSRETFDPSAFAADDFGMPDWSLREAIEASVVGDGPSPWDSAEVDDSREL